MQTEKKVEVEEEEEVEEVEKEVEHISKLCLNHQRRDKSLVLKYGNKQQFLHQPEGMLRCLCQFK